VIVTHISARIGAIYAGPTPLCPLHLGWHCRRGRHRSFGPQCTDRPTAASGPNEPMSARNRRLNGGLNQSSPRRQRARGRNTGKRGITAIVSFTGLRWMREPPALYVTGLRPNSRASARAVMPQPGHIGCSLPRTRWSQRMRWVASEFAVPLCRGHHREVLRCGDEAAR
jgi:hypothetical protein